jgi:hypothetical protein
MQTNRTRKTWKEGKNLVGMEGTLYYASWEGKSCQNELKIRKRRVERERNKGSRLCARGVRASRYHDKYGKGVDSF